MSRPRERGPVAYIPFAHCPFDCCNAAAWDGRLGGSVRTAWPVACICLLGVFGGALIHSREYPLHDALGFGPGFFPFCLSVIGLVLSAVLLVQALRGKMPGEPEPDPAAGEPPPGPLAALKAAAVVGAMILAAAALAPLGYRLTVLALIAGLLPVLGARSVAAVALTAVAGSFGVFHVFYHWLKVPLPVGAFGI